MLFQPITQMRYNVGMRRILDPISHLLTRIEQTSCENMLEPCWIFTGALDTKGYAQLRVMGKTQMAHRAMYESRFGAIGSGMQLDHLCRNRACINPSHMEPVTNRENQLRGLKGALKTHCAQGHAYSGDNIYRHMENGRRRTRCRECNRAKARKVA